MILRRVIDHVRKQEWTAIVIDFVIVVLGVFVGIQVSNWNAAQADKRLGRDYAARLTVDVRNDLATRRTLVAYYGAVLDAVERTNAMFKDSTVGARELVVTAYRASEVNYLPPTRATWDEIVASGDVDLLPRAAVDGGLSNYYADDTARLSFDSVGASAYRLAVRTTIPLEIQKAIRAGCGDVRNETQQITGFMPDCTLNVDPALVAQTAAALRADPAIANNLRYQYSQIYSARANISGDVVHLERALAALDPAPSAEPGAKEP